MPLCVAWCATTVLARCRRRARRARACARTHSRTTARLRYTCCLHAATARCVRARASAHTYFAIAARTFILTMRVICLTRVPTLLTSAFTWFIHPTHLPTYRALFTAFCWTGQGRVLPRFACLAPRQTVPLLTILMPAGTLPGRCLSPPTAHTCALVCLCMPAVCGGLVCCVAVPVPVCVYVCLLPSCMHSSRTPTYASACLPFLVVIPSLFCTFLHDVPVPGRHFPCCNTGMTGGKERLLFPVGVVDEPHPPSPSPPTRREVTDRQTGWCPLPATTCPGSLPDNHSSPPTTTYPLPCPLPSLPYPLPPPHHPSLSLPVPINMSPCP